MFPNIYEYVMLVRIVDKVEREISQWYCPRANACYRGLYKKEFKGKLI
jgi:hypothetical protein